MESDPAPPRRIPVHPILPRAEEPTVEFTFNGEPLRARAGEMLSSALFAAGVHVFGHHPKDDAPQGMFCSNGQCSQCTVIADGVAIKSCITPVSPGMDVRSCEGVPPLPYSSAAVSSKPIETLECDLLVIGGGPSGLAAALEAADAGLNVLIVDDKDRLGGKLVLQTHTFFGSVEDASAGTRGIDIATNLAQEIAKRSNIRALLETAAVGVFCDRAVGVLTGNRTYRIIRPGKLLIAAGAREKSLVFPGNTLPGVIGAGAFQTLVNRDLVECSRRLFVVGGGNVGLIAGYHALQAGMEVAGLAEIMQKLGGYRVHADKLRRLGVPIYTGTTVVRADGEETLESVTIAPVDENFQPVMDKARTYSVDTLLIAVGLSPVDEFTEAARAAGIPTWVAGDAEEIGEASAAVFGGRIRGRELAGLDVPPDFREKEQILKSPPGEVFEEDLEPKCARFPVLHCVEEIPCDPCRTVCPEGSITLVPNRGDILDVPTFSGECTGCLKCVAICPGLAITLVSDYDERESTAQVTIPFELIPHFDVDDEITLTDTEGEIVGNGTVRKILRGKWQDRTLLVRVEVRREIATLVAGILVQPVEASLPLELEPDGEALPPMVCRCERVSVEEIRRYVKSTVLTDISQLKALRVGMGGCGGKTCTQVLGRVLAEEGVDIEKLESAKPRPPNQEVELASFAGVCEVDI
jgi:sarcosine oxidase subunit alpha